MKDTFANHVATEAKLNTAVSIQANKPDLPTTYVARPQHGTAICATARNKTYMKQGFLLVQQKSRQLCVALESLQILLLLHLIVFSLARSNSLFLHCFSSSVFLFCLFDVGNGGTFFSSVAFPPLFTVWGWTWTYLTRWELTLPSCVREGHCQQVCTRLIVTSDTSWLWLVVLILERWILANEITATGRSQRQLTCILFCCLIIMTTLANMTKKWSQTTALRSELKSKNRVKKKKNTNGVSWCGSSSKWQYFGSFSGSLRAHRQTSQRETFGVKGQLTSTFISLRSKWDRSLFKAALMSADIRSLRFCCRREQLSICWKRSVLKSAKIWKKEKKRKAHQNQYYMCRIPDKFTVILPAWHKN